MKTVKRLLSAAAMVVTAMFAAPQLAPAPAHADATSTKVQLAFESYVSCANDVAAFSGSINIVGGWVIDSGGGLHLLGHQNLQGFDGYSVMNNTHYAWTGAQSNSINATSGGTIEESYVEQLQIVSSGSATSNFFLTIVYHLVATPNGLVVVVDNTSVQCQSA